MATIRRSTRRSGRRCGRRRGLVASLAAGVAALAVCGASLATGAQGASTPILVVSRPAPPLLPSDPPRGLLFAVAPGMDRASVFLDVRPTAAGPSLPIGISYVAVDGRGTGYVTVDDGPYEAAPGGILIVPNLLEPGGADLEGSVVITGPATNLVDPKDIVTIATPAGETWLAVADFGSAAVHVFDGAARGDAAPLFSLPRGITSGAEASVWGLHYDVGRDRLFVSTTDGFILVYDAFVDRRGAAGPDRFIEPTLAGAPASANLHGISHHADSDTLIVTDVGTQTTPEHGPDFARNGALLVIADAGAADGPTPVRARIAGHATLLGNPLDVLLGADGSVYVAEGANQLVLRFAAVLASVGAIDMPPDGAIGVAAPESLVTPP